VLVAGRHRAELYGNDGDDEMISGLNGYADSFSGGAGYDTAFLDAFDIGDAERRVTAR
jgi:hypothetical protein